MSPFLSDPAKAKILFVEDGMADQVLRDELGLSAEAALRAFNPDTYLDRDFDLEDSSSGGGSSTLDGSPEQFRAQRPLHEGRRSGKLV